MLPFLNQVDTLTPFLACFNFGSGVRTQREALGVHFILCLLIIDDLVLVLERNIVEVLIYVEVSVTLDLLVKPKLIAHDR